MANEPVTIGDQKFINDPDLGWIDAKTRKPADKGLVRLLDSLDVKPVEKKLRIKIDKTIDPVTIAGQKFVYDSNSNAWIDFKTKVKAPESLQKTLNSVSINSTIAATLGTVENVADKFGTVGEVAKSKVSTKQKKPTKTTGTGTLPAAKKQKNDPLVPILLEMANIVASIDSMISYQLSAIKAKETRKKEELDEWNVEHGEDRAAALRAATDADKQDATKESSNAGNIAAAGLFGIAAYSILKPALDPIKETLTDLVDTFVDLGEALYDGFGALADIFGGMASKTVRAASWVATSLGYTAGPDIPRLESRRPPSTSPTTNTTVTTPPEPPTVILPTGDNQPPSTPEQPNNNEIVVTAPRSPKPKTRTRSGGNATPVATTPTRPPASPPPAQRTSAPPMSPGSPASPSTPPETNENLPNWFATAPIGTVWMGNGFMVKKNSTTDYSIKSPGNEPIRGESAKNALYYIEVAKLKSSTGKNDPSGAGGKIGVTSINPRDVLNFTARTGDEAHFNGLESATKEAILAAAQEYLQTTGRKLTINSAKRSEDEQRHLYNNPQGHIVARPGTSAHESGYAVDIDEGQRDPVARSILEKHGMKWYGSGDDVHFTLSGHGGFGGGDGGAATAIANKVGDLGEFLGQAFKAVRSAMVTQQGMSTQVTPGTVNNREYTIQREAISETLDQVEAVTPPAPPPPPPPPQLPNLNPGGGTIKNPASPNDKRIIMDYLRYFDISVPTSTATALAMT